MQTEVEGEEQATFEQMQNPRASPDHHVSKLGSTLLERNPPIQLTGGSGEQGSCSQCQNRLQATKRKSAIDLATEMPLISQPSRVQAWVCCDAFALQVRRGALSTRSSKTSIITTPRMATGQTHARPKFPPLE